MSLTYVSPKRPNRVYVRKFDHDEAKRRFEAGESIAAIARTYGITARGVGRVVSPVQAASARRREDALRLAGKCDRCDGAMNKQSRYNGSLLCVKCAGDDLATSVRATELRCTSCQEWKLDEDFPRNRAARRRHRGRHHQCRVCNTKARREYRRRNRAADNAYQRAYRVHRMARS